MYVWICVHKRLPLTSRSYTMFYKKSEQPVRNTITFGAYSSVINGLIGFGIGFIPAGSGSFTGWRWLFVVLGGVSVVWSVFVFFCLPDNPGNARWLTSREKAMVVRRVSENQTGIENKQWKWYQVRECFFDYRTWILFFYVIGVTIPNGGLNTFNGLVIKSLGFNSRQTSLLQIPTGMMLGLLQQGSPANSHRDLLHAGCSRCQLLRSAHSPLQDADDGHRPPGPDHWDHPEPRLVQQVHKGRRATANGS